MQPGSHEVTPIKIGDRLFVTTGLSQLAAIDAGSGETRGRCPSARVRFGHAEIGLSRLHEAPAHRAAVPLWYRLIRPMRAERPVGGDDGDAGDAPGRIYTHRLSAGGRKVAGSNPVAPIFV